MTTDTKNMTVAEIAAQCRDRIKQPTISQIADSMMNGIGMEIRWEFHGTRQTPEQLRQRVAAAGMMPDRISDIDPIAGLKRAVSEWKRRQGRKTLAHAEIVAEDTAAKEVVVGILYHNRVGSREVAKTQREIMVWSTATDSWTEPGTSDEANDLRRRVAIRQAYYDGNDVRDLLVMPALRNAQAVISGRGSYYVAISQLDHLLSLEAAVDGMEGFKLDPQGVESGAGGDARMAHAAVSKIGDSLAELEDQIEGWIDMSRAPGTNTEEHVMGRFDELASMARLYESSLEIKLEDLRDLIEDMRATASDRIQDKRDEAESRRESRNKAIPVDRRAVLAAMDDAKLATLWGFKVGSDVDMPADRDELLDRLVEALEAAA